MELEKAIKIVEDMCFRYGKPEQSGRNQNQIEEITAINIVLNKAMGRELNEKRWIN